MNLRLTLRTTPSRTDLHSVATVRLSFHNTPTGVLTFTDRDGHEQTIQLRHVELMEIDDRPGGG
jgi:hypothetical protein